MASAMEKEGERPVSLALICMRHAQICKCMDVPSNKSLDMSRRLKGGSSQARYWRDKRSTSLSRLLSLSSPSPHKNNHWHAYTKR
mmetsp:Transcript_32816/g.67782  ORF Transcript_32816/g.67782 Transcript_32816/m.67782 type:complete len:85 (-) Transcript_32816:107-361(-)